MCVCLLTYLYCVNVQRKCTTSYITQTAVCPMPSLGLPYYFGSDAVSTPSNISGAVASFVSDSRRADVFIGVRMSNPLSYRNLLFGLEFFPPPTIFPARDKITINRSKTDTLTIKVRLERYGVVNELNWPLIFRSKVMLLKLLKALLSLFKINNNRNSNFNRPMVFPNSD